MVQWYNEAATVHADITADHRDVPARSMWMFIAGTVDSGRLGAGFDSFEHWNLRSLWNLETGSRKLLQLVTATQR